jgi:hypothetical protein
MQQEHLSRIKTETITMRLNCLDLLRIRRKNKFVQPIEFIKASPSATLNKTRENPAD